jgi:hypothetical protein
MFPQTVINEIRTLRNMAKTNPKARRAFLALRLFHTAMKALLKSLPGKSAAVARWASLESVIKGEE